MKFFIDTANLEEIKEANDLGILDGVTTNPSLMAKEGITGEQNILDHYVTICNIVDGPVSAEVISTDFAGIIREGEHLASLHNNIVVKVPMILEGIKAIKYFSSIPSLAVLLERYKLANLLFHFTLVFLNFIKLSQFLYDPI